jgi:murein DD-endopeptidase MepM/ murein hydrolase activator NlpD
MEGIMVTVKKGDNLSLYAKKFKVDINNILSVNKLNMASVLKINDKIFIPGDKLTNLAKSFAKRKDGVSFLWPAESKRLTSRYGYRIHPIYKRKILHHGIDIGGPQRSKIYATESGRIYFRGYIRGYGKVLIINHQSGYQSYYAHLSDYSRVKRGEFVEQGQLIALMGKTGRVTGTHLHFEIRRYGKSVDPLKYISRR